MPKITVNDILRVGRYRLLRLFGTTDYTPFIILSRSRTGSNLLNSSLGSHPNVHVKGEHFGHLRGDTIEKRHAQVFGKQPRHIKAAGCKVFYYHPHHGDPDSLFAMLKADPHLKVIHLKRQDKLRSVLSWMIARHNDTYTATSEAGLVPTEDKRIEVDPTELVDWIERTTQWERWGDAFFCDRAVLSITYEEMTADMPTQFSKVLRYLELPSDSPSTRLRRQNPEPVEDLITNWPEVRAALAAHGFDRFIPARG